MCKLELLQLYHSYRMVTRFSLENSKHTIELLERYGNRGLDHLVLTNLTTTNVMGYKSFLCRHLPGLTHFHQNRTKKIR